MTEDVFCLFPAFNIDIDIDIDIYIFGVAGGGRRGAVGM